MSRCKRTDECLLLVEAIEKSGVLSRAELKKLTKRIFRFEDKLGRTRVGTAEAILEYIQYIRYLEFQHHRRVKSAGIISVSPFKRFTLNIFRHGIARFPTDSNLWLLFLSYGASQGVRRVVSHSLTQALRLNPTSAGLWAYAASWEFAKEGNPFGARLILQRGLRNCPDARELWREYFNLELKYVDKIKSRNATLNPEPQGGETRTQNSTSLTVHDGAFAASVYEAAKSRCCGDFRFLLHFLLAVSTLTWAMKLQRHIYKDLCDSFPEHAAHLVLAYKRRFSSKSRDTYTYLARSLSLKEEDEKFQKLFVAFDGERRVFTAVADCLQNISGLSSLHGLILSRRNFNEGSKQCFVGAHKVRSRRVDAVGKVRVYTFRNMFCHARYKHTSRDNDYLNGGGLLFSPRDLIEAR
jgi:hypothetical protein